MQKVSPLTIMSPATKKKNIIKIFRSPSVNTNPQQPLNAANSRNGNQNQQKKTADVTHQQSNAQHNHNSFL
jgi:hypothetical protein